MLIDLMETENSGKLHEVGARLRNAQTWIKDANGGCPGRSIWWHVEYGTTGLHAKGTTKDRGSHETLVPVDPELQLWRNRRLVSHKLVPCYWNSRMPDDCHEDNRLSQITSRIRGSETVEESSDDLCVCMGTIVPGKHQNHTDTVLVSSYCIVEDPPEGYVVSVGSPDPHGDLQSKVAETLGMDPELDIYPFSAPLDFDINGVKAGSVAVDS
ncbi:Porphobilinogen deaminase [Trichinella spiralis]|uniref:Porphobilinogen deaminase n=1 Tax=Trichinella spiralis TaxID=6334 RepID=A0ABR3K3Q2_TRISP